MEEKYLAIMEAIRKNKLLDKFQDMKVIGCFLGVYYERIDSLAIGEIIKLCTIHSMIFWLSVSAKSNLIFVNIVKEQ
jgi:hypothetical protein